MTKARAIIDQPASGAWNMAVDHALLESANRSGQVSIRFYSWSEPTLSLGYFQRQQCRNQHRSSRNCPLVRRSTGGGAILHDQEITYSLCVPSNHRWSAANEDLYFMMHEILVDLLREYEISASLFDSPNPRRGDDEFLCFLRRSKGDLIVSGSKICGSAQRRRKNALLQHGSVLFSCSPKALELPGIEELTGTKIDRSKFVDKWISRLENRLKLNFPVETMNEVENKAVQDAENSLYSRLEWTNRR